MVNHLSFHQLRLHLAAMIQGHTAELNAELARYRQGVTIQETLHYFRRELPGVDQWTIMLEQYEEAVSYNQVFPATSVTEFKLAVWGVGQIETDEDRDDITAILASGLKAFLNSRHAATEIEGGKWLYFKDPPVQRVSYGIPSFGDTKTGAFNLLFFGRCDIIDRDPRYLASQLGSRVAVPNDPVVPI